MKEKVVLIVELGTNAIVFKSTIVGNRFFLFLFVAIAPPRLGKIIEPSGMICFGLTSFKLTYRKEHVMISSFP